MTTDTTTETFEDRLRGIVAQIELGMNCQVRIGFSAERQEHFVQIKCYRMDVITKKMGWGRGGKYWPSPHSTRNEIVQAIFGLYKGYWEHEARENFTYRGRRVFGPHMDVDQIWTVANKVDVRSLKHVEDQDPEPVKSIAIDGYDEVNAQEEARMVYSQSQPLHEQRGTVRLAVVSPFARDIKPEDVPQIPWPATEDEVLKLYMSGFRLVRDITPRQEQAALEIFARATQLAAEGTYDKIVLVAGRRVSLLKEAN
ncbi:hypothetical protein SEA_MAGRITTE_180 [Microbacterium phage Magritte]|nr:hypothetical protein SEA_MAGRITTE_180 [Microbacterium phage Magritte]